MKRLTGAALVAALLAGGAMPAGAALVRTGGVIHRQALSASVPATGWVATATKSMLPPSGVVDLGLVPAATPLRVVVGLTPNKAAAESELRAIYTPGSAQYHKFLTPAQYTAAFGPSNAAVSAVVSYLKALGFTNVASTPNNLLVRANGNAALASAAFNTSIHSFNHSGTAYFANITPVMVPQLLGAYVTGVLGLQNLPMQLALRHPSPANRARLHRMALARVAAQRAELARTGKLRRNGMKTLALTPGIQPCTGLQFIPGYGPPPVSVPLPDAGGPCAGRPYTTNDLRLVYDDQNSPIGSNTNVAVFTEGNISGIVTDLQLNERDNGLRQVPVNIVPVDFQSQDVYGQGEWTMDTQASTGIAGDVKSLTLYNAGSLDDNDITMTINRWVTDDVAQNANASFGECEYQAYLDASMAIDDFELQEGALQGQTLFASSGDSGSSCGYNIVTNGLGPAGPPQVVYPAASPYAMGAGGTSLLSQYDGSYFGEISWYSGGGGLSLFEAPEFWTYSVVPTQCLPVYCSIAGPGLPVAVTSGLGRAVPDVAMDADVDVGPVIYYEYGAITENGGTSLASPLSMGTFTRLQSRHNNQLGFAAPNLYASYVAAGGAFGTLAVPTPPAITNSIGGMHDIAYGANGIYAAMPGFDFNTGMGSFDISNLIIAFGG